MIYLIWIKDHSTVIITVHFDLKSAKKHLAAEERNKNEFKKVSSKFKHTHKEIYDISFDQKEALKIKRYHEANLKRRKAVQDFLRS